MLDNLLKINLINGLLLIEMILDMLGEYWIPTREKS